MAETLLGAAWLVPVLPAAAFVVIVAVGRRLPARGAEVGIAAMAVAFILTVGLVGAWIAHPEPVGRQVVWWQAGGTEFGAGVRVDGLAVMMLTVVTVVSLMVQVYSTGYMRGDRRYTWYFAVLSLFSASMLTLVLADNLLVLLVAWELVGVCSFLLIGHWFEDKPNSDAALKAFLTTRTGDVGLTLGAITLFFAAGGSFDIERINRLALTRSPTVCCWPPRCCCSWG